MNPRIGSRGAPAHYTPSQPQVGTCDWEQWWFNNLTNPNPNPFRAERLTFRRRLGMPLVSLPLFNRGHGDKGVCVYE